MSTPDKVMTPCPSCGARLGVPLTAAGKKIRCPKCQTIVAITADMVNQPPEMVVPPASVPQPAQRLEVSLGGENTFAGAQQKKKHAPESLGDQATFGGNRVAADDHFTDDMEIVDLAGRYKVEGVLGKGGMGEVQLATDTRLNRKVAIKRMLGDAAKSRTAVSRFLIEAKSIAALNHPNIVQIYDYGRDKDGPFLILEYVDGQSLLDKCQGGALSLEMAVDLTCQLCDGLSKAHEAGIIHRDIKPANVLMTKQGIPKLTDFGLAKDEASDGGLSVAGAVLGTLDFMPPEQRKDVSLTDSRSDLWSLAATLYQMVTGKSPRIIQFNHVPQSLQVVLGKALEEKKDDRYQSAAEFRNALREAIAESRATLTDLAEGQCPSCGTKNEANRKFCRKCAVSLEVKCLSCSKGMPVWDEICGGCGAKQSPLITSRKEQLQQRQFQAEGFLQEGKFREATQIAEELQNESDPRFQHVKKWSAEFTEGLRQEQQQQQQRSGVLYKEAKTHQTAHDYSSAIHALEQIPASLRSPDISALLMQVQTQEERTKELNDEIRLRVERRELDGLIARVDELLQLVPDRVDLRELRETLEKRNQQRLAARSSASLEANRLMDARKYAECVAVLQSIKGSLRTPEIEALQKDAAAKQSRLESLQRTVDKAVKNNQLQGLLARVDELLLLKSDASEGDKQLREQLVAREQKQKSQIKALLQKVHQLRKEIRFDEAMELLRRVPEELQNEAISTAIDDLQFFADQRSGAIESLTQATNEQQIKEALVNADEYRGTLTSAIIADVAFESAMKECRQRLEDLRQAQEFSIRRRQRQKKLIIVGSVVSLLLLVAVAGFVTQRQQRLTAIADALQRGDAAMEAADFTTAMAAYDEVVQLDDTVADAWAGLAIAKLQQTPPDVAGAFSDLEKGLALSPDGEKLQQARRLGHPQRAMERANAGSISEALQDIAEAEKLSAPAEGVTAAKSAVGTAYLKRAEEAVAAKQPDAAVKELEDARSISPLSDQLPRVNQMIADAYLDRADASLQQSAVEPALADIEFARAIQADLPRIPELQAAALVIRAQQALQAGDRDKASADFLASKNLSSKAAGLGALAASLADGLVQRCEEAFSDASFQEATAALQTVAELDPQSITLAPLQDRLSKALIVEADKGLLAKEGDRVFLLIQSLTALQLQPAEQTRLSNGLAAQYFENCQQQVAAGDLQGSVSTFERLLALGSVDEEKKQQAVAAFLSVIEPLCLAGLQSQDPIPAIDALINLEKLSFSDQQFDSMAEADVEFSDAFKEQIRKLPDAIKARLPNSLVETYEYIGTIGEGLPLGETVVRRGSVLAVFENSGDSGAVLLFDINTVQREPVRLSAPIRSLGARSFGGGMASIKEGLVVGEHFSTTRTPHDGIAFIFKNVDSPSPQEAGRFHDLPQMRGGYFGQQIASFGDSSALFFQGYGHATAAATRVISFDESAKPIQRWKLDFPHVIQWPAALTDKSIVCLERDREGNAYLVHYELQGNDVSRQEIQAVEIPSLSIKADPKVKDLISPLLADQEILAALIRTEGDPVAVLLRRTANGIYETLHTECKQGDIRHALANDILFLTTRVDQPGVKEGEIRLLSAAKRGKLIGTLPRSGATNVKVHGKNVFAFDDLVVVRDELESGTALRLFRSGFRGVKTENPVLIRPSASEVSRQSTWAELVQAPVEYTNSVGMKFVILPPADGPAPAASAKPSVVKYMGLCEVTQADFQRITGRNPSEAQGGQLPVEMVTVEDAIVFCANLSDLPEEQKANCVYRLPSDQEWESAARGDTADPWFFGNSSVELKTFAWYKGNSSLQKTREVALKPCNPWGFFDIYGNVWEWTQEKNLRGGSCRSDAELCVSTDQKYRAGDRRSDIGFRVLLEKKIQ